MKYILTETEYQEIRASKKQAHEFLTLKEAQKINASRLKLVTNLCEKKPVILGPNTSALHRIPKLE